MDTRAILDELIELLEQAGVCVRRDDMGGGGGGLCVIKGKKLFFVDTECPASEMVAISSRAVNELVDVETVYIRPQVRQMLEKYGHVSVEF
jgi:hypothetical protein